MNSPKGNTDAALAELDRERAWWEGILSDIGNERMESSGIMGSWTPKDLVAHLNGWQRKTLDNLAAASKGAPKPPTRWPESLNTPVSADEEDDFEGINQWIYQRNRDRPAAEVLAESRAQWDDLRALVVSLPEDRLNDTTLFPQFEGRSMAEALAAGTLFGHFHEEHEPDIRAWLNAQADAT